MLKLKNIKKSYRIGEYYQNVLNDINIEFRDKEFVSILGASGSGKTTLLNIIGGLDIYDDGDLVVDGISTSNYKSNDWDLYRNRKIGFIFQNYNLIMHQSILANVELALTLSGVSKSIRRKKALDALKKVGLEQHINKNPNQLSGGQMQRVAIARALVNDPDIILADEPTGALDSKTSIQIMDLLKSISKDKLIIMVTHNSELAKTYSNRIIELKDGNILNDSNPYKIKNKLISKKILKKKSMSLKTSLNLSLKNLLNKKGRTILTSIAGSIGIIGIALVLSLSNGAKTYIENLEKTSSSEYPLKIEKIKIDLFSMLSDNNKNIPTSEDIDSVISYDDITNKLKSNTPNYKQNDIKSFKKYLENNKLFKKYSKDIKYVYDFEMQVFKKENNNYLKTSLIDLSTYESGDESSNTYDNLFFELSTNKKILDDSYEIVKGHMPTKKEEVVLIINEKCSIPDSILYSLNIKDRNNFISLINDIKSNKNIDVENSVISYNDILVLKYKLITTLDYYKLDNNVIKDMKDDTQYMNKIIDGGLDLEIVGILKTDDNHISNVIGYTEDLTKYLIEKTNNNKIAKLQTTFKDINIFTGLKFDNLENSYENNLNKLGIMNEDNISSIDIYPNNERDKKSIIELINKYNKNLEDSSKIEYTDTMQEVIKTVKTFVNVISYVIIAFVAISLVVSSIMIAIITYISVLERTKEIGILRAIGASKKDVVRVFKAETIIEGFTSGILGVFVTIIINFLINIILKFVFKMESIAILPIIDGITLIILSVIITVIAGLIPSKMASRKNPVEALKTE